MDLNIYYHVAMMPGWEKIVKEQLAVAKHVGLPCMNIHAVGSRADCVSLESMVGDLGSVTHASQRFCVFEFPTVHALWEHAKLEPGAAYMYWHTKGVSKPGGRLRVRWRRAMQKLLVFPWRNSLASLETHDVTGPNLQFRRGVPPHFQGNFWMATGRWISLLSDPTEWSKPGHRFTVPGSRYRAECWILSRNGYNANSLGGMNSRWMLTRRVPDYDVAGFSYKEFDE